MRDASLRRLVIVNADDLGLRREVTDAILECWEAGRITSATAMVYMADSARAAELVRRHGLPTGLHLNLTTPYTDPAVPPELAARQAALVDFFRTRRRRWLPSPRRQAAIAACIADQLSEFGRLYNRSPTHADGHEHIHCSPSVFLSRELHPVRALRLSHTFRRRDSPWPKRLARSIINLTIRTRFRTTARFMSLRDLHPALGGSGLERILGGTPGSVEVMVHPAWRDEHEVLLSRQWQETLAQRSLGSYDTLTCDRTESSEPLTRL